MAVDEEDFLRSPLAVWVSTFYASETGGTFSVNVLCDGRFLVEDVWSQIDPSATCGRDTNSAATSNTSAAAVQAPSTSTPLSIVDRLRNLSLLLSNIQTFYRELLDQVLLLPLPSISTIAHYDPAIPSTWRGAFDELDTLLLLLLGCAVQCDKKEEFILHLKTLPVDTQHALMQCIQRITDNPTIVWSLDTLLPGTSNSRSNSPFDNNSSNQSTNENSSSPGDVSKNSDVAVTSSFSRAVIGQIRALCADRDRWAAQSALQSALMAIAAFSNGVSVANDTGAENNNDTGSLNNAHHHHNNNNNNNHHYNRVASGGNFLAGNANSTLSVELAAAKSKLRRLQQELEERLEQTQEQTEELDALKASMGKLRQENLALLQEARSAKAYRDEVDILRERCCRLDALETEVQKYKDKMSELSYARNRVEELKEEKRLLTETKTLLEEQLEASRRRTEALAASESEWLRWRVQLTEVEADRDVARDRVRKLSEDNAKLTVDYNALKDEVARLQGELSIHQVDSVGDSQQPKSLLEQLHSETETRLLQAQLEQSRLEMSAEQANRERDQERDKARQLQGALDSANERITQLKSEVSRMEEMEQQLNATSLEKQRLQRLLDAANARVEETCQQVAQIEAENSKLNSSIESLRLGVERTNVMERDLAALESARDCWQHERRSLEKECARLRDSLETRAVECDRVISQLNTAQNELKHLRSVAETTDSTATRLKEVERELKEATESKSVTQQTMDALRRQLVEEKIHSQDLDHELRMAHAQLDALEEERKKQSQWSRPQSSSESSSSQAPASLEEELIHSAVSAATSGHTSTTTSPGDSGFASPAVDNGVMLESGGVTTPGGGNTAVTPHVGSSSGSSATPKLVSRVAQLKERVVDLEKKKSFWEEECQRLRTQLEDSQCHLNTERQQRLAATTQNTQLQSEHAKLEVEYTVQSSRNVVLSSQNSELRVKMADLEACNVSLDAQLIETKELLRQQQTDYQQLSSLHSQLSGDYERLNDAHCTLKMAHKHVKNELATLHSRLDESLSMQQTLKEQLREQRALEKAGRLSPAVAIVDAEEVVSLRESLAQADAQFVALEEDHRRSMHEYRLLENKLAQATCNVAEQGDERSMLEAELQRVQTSYEVLVKTTRLLREERAQLVTQLDALWDAMPLLSLNGMSTDEHVAWEAKRNAVKDSLRHYGETIQKQLSFIGADGVKAANGAVTMLRDSSFRPTSRSPSPRQQPTLNGKPHINGGGGVGDTVSTTVNVVQQFHDHHHHHHAPQQQQQSIPQSTSADGLLDLHRESAFSRSPPKRHSMYSRPSRPSGGDYSQLLQSLNKSSARSSPTSPLDDVTTGGPSTSTPRRQQDVWYEYGCV